MPTRLRRKLTRERKTCTITMPLPNKIWSRLSRLKCRRGGDLAAAEAALKVLGISDPDALVKSPPSFKVPVRAPISGEVVEQDVAVGQLLQLTTTQCFL